MITKFIKQSMQNIKLLVVIITLNTLNLLMVSYGVYLLIKQQP